MISRRQFIKSTGLAAAALSLTPGFLKAMPVKKNIGLQLYTVRDQLGKDLPGTLKAVAEIGYTWLEAAGYNEGKFYGLAPKEFRKMVEDLGMTLVSSHVSFGTEQLQQVADAHNELGVSYVVYPWMSMPAQPTRDDYTRAAELFNELGEGCNQAGLKFGYHNHDFEFVRIDDTTGFDILVEMTKPGSVCFEADLYWMKYAGVDPMDYFNKYPGRFELWHVKDMDNTTERKFAPVGSGIINFAEIFENKNVSGMKYFFVEQDTCYEDPLKSVATSLSNLEKLVYSK